MGVDSSADALVPDHKAVEHVVILIHGIRDRGAWHRTVNQVFGSPRVKVIMPKYGWFSPLRFIAPWDASTKPMKLVFSEYTNAKLEYPNAKVSVIAHSFGTHLLTKLLEEHPQVRIWRIILCGSVVKQDFRWEKYWQCFGSEKNKAGFIVNDCGNRDSWPVIGAFGGWRYGDAGTYGFGRDLYVQNRFHDGGHSLFFDSGFIETYWKPFILEGRVVTGNAEQGEGIPCYIKLLYKLPFNLQGLLVLAVIVFFGVRWWLAVPPKIDITFPAFVAEFNNAESKGEIALRGFVDRYAGCQVTWNCFIRQVKASERSYKIGATRDANRSNQVLAVFAEENEFNPYLREGDAVKIEGVLSVNQLGAILNECHLVSRGN